MRELLISVTEFAVVIIDGIALLVVIVGTVAAFVAVVRALSPLSGSDRRAVWLNYARWLVAGLTFQLAADIIESAITESWDAVGRLAAVAVIRTFLDYFLERDMNDVRGRARTTETPAR